MSGSGSERRQDACEAPSAGDCLRREALLLSRHLVSEPPDQAEVESYVRAHRQLGIEISSPGDRRLWELSLKHAWALPYFDAGLAVLDPASVIRHKILVMLAVLEASPRHCDRFIRQDSGILPVIGMCASVLRGVFRVAIGVLALKALRLR